jgi:hypothetical protein
VGSQGPRRIYLAIPDLCSRLVWFVQEIENHCWNSSEGEEREKQEREGVEVGNREKQ